MQARILIVIDGFFIGGTETQILSTVPDLLKNGAHVVIVGAHGPLIDSFRALGCKIYEVKFPLDETVPTSTWQDIEANLTSIINSEAINLIHAHQVPSARFIMRLARRRNLPFFFSVHGTYYDIRSLKAMLEGSVNVISVSQPIHDWLLANKIHSRILPNGILLENYPPLNREYIRAEFGLSQTTPVILYAGRIAWEKADICIQLMEACHQVRLQSFPDLRLFIAGDGTGYNAVAKHAQHLHTLNQQPFITCLGDQLNMNRIFALADCVVGTGRVAIEAMACERAVVAAGSRGMVGLLSPENFDTAIRYHFGDHKADRAITQAELVDAINTVLSSPESRARLGTQGRQCVESNFNIHHIAMQLDGMYRVALG